MNNPRVSIYLVCSLFITTKWLFLLLPLSSTAQEMWGIANSNYAGNMGLHLNPASIVGAPYKYEFNLIAGDFFVDNNIGYYTKFSDFTSPVGADKRFYPYNNTATKHGYSHTNIIGPSYILNKGDKAYAIQTHLRSIASVNDLSYNLVNTLNQASYPPQQGVVYENSTVKAAGLVFGDIGLTYGQTIISNEKHWLAWGATLHGIVAFDGMYLNANLGSYVVTPSNTWEIQNMDIDYAHASANFGNSAPLSEILAIRGAGLSADGGLIYMHKRLPSAFKCDRDADKAKRYDYRLGVSLLDMGYVSFFNSAARYRLQGASTTWNGIDSVRIKNIIDFDKTLSNQFLGSPDASRRGNNFGMLTPAALSVQFDYCLKPSWYANLSVVQRIPFTYKEVMRANQVALVPRYETRRFEASASVNVYEYEHVSMGAAVRWWIFVLGSDRLLSFFSSPVRSADFFFGLRYNSCTMNSKKNKAGQCPFD